MSDTGATGTNTYLKFTDTVLSTNYRSFTFSDEMGLVDQSAGSDAGRQYLTTLRDGTMGITIKHKAGDTATWAAIAPGSAGTLEWGEEGTASTKPKHTVYAIIQNRNQGGQYDGLITVDLTFQFSDDDGVVNSAYS